MTDLDEVYSKFSGTVTSYLLRLCGNQQLAEELTQETFYQAVRCIGRFDGKSSISTWLCSIARHLYYDYLRKQKPTTGDGYHSLTGRLYGPDRKPGPGHACPPGAARAGGALPGSVHPAHLLRSLPQPDRGTVREERILVPGHLLPGPSDVTESHQGGSS